MDARVGPVRLPAIEIGLTLVDVLKTLALQRCPLRVAHAGLDLALAVGVAHAARQRNDAIVRQHVAIERIDCRVVCIRTNHSLAQVVEHDHPHAAAEPAESPLVQLRPDRVEDRSTISRTDLRLYPSVKTNSRVRRYLPVSRLRTIGPSP